MPNPYAPRNRRASTASFPEGRLRRLGADDDEIAEALRGWADLSAGEQQEAADAIAALTDDELTADLADGREARELERLSEWAKAATDAGTYGDPNEALDALDMVALLSDADRAELAAAAEQPVCQICAVLPDDVRATLPEHTPAAHVGDADHGLVFAAEPPFIDHAPETDAPVFSRAWFEAALPEGPAVVAEHGEIAPGGPGEAAEGSADGNPAAGPDASPVLEDARGRMGQAPSKVLRWVGTDRERAAAVLVLERQADKPRVALVSGAEQVLGA